LVTYTEIDYPTIETPFVAHQSHESVRFVTDVTLNNEVSGRREGYSTFKHKTRERERERENSAEKTAVLLSDQKLEAVVRR